MYRRVAPLFAIGLLAFVTFLGFFTVTAAACDMVVALSSKVVREFDPLDVDGQFLLKELEAIRLRLDGGPVEQLFPEQAKHRRDGVVLDPDCPDLTLLYKFSIPLTEDPLDVAYRLSKVPGVEWADPLLEAMEFDWPETYSGEDIPPRELELGLESTDDYIVPNDPLFSTQGALVQMRFPEAWSISTGSTQVVICGIDGGYTDSHEDLIGSMWDNPEEANGPSDTNGYIGDIHGWNFSGNTPYVWDSFHPGADHGVCCTSVYSARGNNGIGIAGMLWDATVMVCIRDWNIPQLDGIKSAVYAADNGARVAHLGMGSPDYYGKTGKSMVQYARSKGLLVYAGVANFGIFQPHYPAAYKEIVGVAGVDRNDVPMGTNYGDWTDVSAPLEVDICRTCTPDGGYGYGGGTSISNPYAAGVAALTLSAHPDWDTDLLDAHIRATAVQTNPLNENVRNERNAFEIGPRVDAYGALSTEPRIEFSPKFWFLRPVASSGQDPENFELFLALENTWKGASNVQISLFCDDPMVSVSGGPCPLGDMRPLQVLSGPAPFTIEVSSDCPANYSCALQLEVDADGLSEPQRFALDVVINRGLTALDGWPGEELDPHLFPPMRADLNGDGIPEIVCPTGVACHVFSISGEKIDEIPVKSGSNSPAVVDLDGDLADEIVFLDPYHQVRVFDQDLGLMTITDGRSWSSLSGYYGYSSGIVSTANLCGNSGRQILVKTPNPDNPSATPMLGALNMDGSFVDGFPIDLFVQSGNIVAADLDGDGLDELAFFASGAFYVVDNRGEVLPGWPFPIDGYEFNPEGPVVMVSAGDLDGDGILEVLGTLGDARVFAFGIDGALLPGWPFQSGTALFASQPVLADVNGDGGREVVLAERFIVGDIPLHRTGGIVHVIDQNARELPGWPVDTGIYRLQPPIACDIDADGKQNVLIKSSQGVFASDEAGNILPGWPITLAPQAPGICCYEQVSIDDLDGDGVLEVGIPIEGRYFIFRLDGITEGAAQWGYKGCSADMRYSSSAASAAPSIAIHLHSRDLFAGMDTLSADIIIANPGAERTIVASAWVEAFDERFYLPSLSLGESTFTLTLPEHSTIELLNVIEIPIPEDIPSMDIVIAAELADSSTATLLSTPSETVRIHNYIPPSGNIVLGGLIGASWQTFSFNSGISSLEPTPLWVFDDGATSSTQSPGHLFDTPGEHTIALILSDERGGSFLATASTMVIEQAGSCPDGMANMGIFCIDIFEASRPDATAFDFGSMDGAAGSIPGVLPWQPASAQEAHLACALAGKRLCTQDEWTAACTGSFGPNGLNYPYGNSWQYKACSDFYTYMDSVTTTGKFGGCVSRAGAQDMVGNIRELVTDGAGTPISFMGGTTYSDPAYPNCRTTQNIESEPWSRALAYGFRCCKDSE
ncbi:MAG: VCBS repeat-containing protein [Candidatus Coatesbacteria bacterium]|nr:VCBS repeat-containing protein [Candidatus Coatesbacteria bacterium]